MNLHNISGLDVEMRIGKAMSRQDLVCISLVFTGLEYLLDFFHLRRRVIQLLVLVVLVVGFRGHILPPHN